MVCSPDALASSAGVAALRAGGTAADAALATSAVLAVTSPHMCGMGGDLFALVHDGPGPPTCLNASGRAGSGADPERLRAEGHTIMPFRVDVRSVPVPGCVDGWLALHERYGRLPLTDVLAPAIGYADEGFPASPLLALAVLLLEGVTGTDDLTGRPLEAGSTVRRPGVARSLRAVVDQGRDGFYQGEFGAGLLLLGNGEYAPDDLAEPLAGWVDPLGLRVHGHDVWTVPPNSQGYLTLLGTAIVEGLALPSDPSEAGWAHLLIEAARAAGHDRDDVLSEGADVARLLDPTEVTARRTRIDPVRRGTWSAPASDGGTIYLCASDAEGRGVSLIQSNAADFGAHLAVGDTGILVHNRGVGFSLQPGHPAEYRPGRRPPSTLSPALVTRPDGSLHATIGTMGGDSQPQVLLQLVTRLLRHGQTPGEAIAARRLVLRGTHRGFDTWTDPDDQEVVIERHHDLRWAEGLTEKGHRVVEEPPGHGFGHAHTIVREEHGWAGAADPRAVTGAAVGY